MDVIQSRIAKLSNDEINAVPGGTVRSVSVPVSQGWHIGGRTLPRRPQMIHVLIGSRFEYAFLPNALVTHVFYVPMNKVPDWNEVLIEIPSLPAA